MSHSAGSFETKHQSVKHANKKWISAIEITLILRLVSLLMVRKKFVQSLPLLYGLFPLPPPLSPLFLFLPQVFTPGCLIYSLMWSWVLVKIECYFAVLFTLMVLCYKSCSVPYFFPLCTMFLRSMPVALTQLAHCFGCSHHLILIHSTSFSQPKTAPGWSFWYLCFMQLFRNVSGSIPRRGLQDHKLYANLIS